MVEKDFWKSLSNEDQKRPLKCWITPYIVDVVVIFQIQGLGKISVSMIFWLLEVMVMQILI